MTLYERGTQDMRVETKITMEKMRWLSLFLAVYAVYDDRFEKDGAVL